MPIVFISLCFSFAASGLLALVFAFSEFATMPLVVLAWCVMLGAFNFLGGRNLSYLAVGRIGAARAGAIVGTSAVFASILAITITGERPHWLVLVGTFVVVGGLATALGKNIIDSSRRPSSAHPSPSASAHPEPVEGRARRAALIGLPAGLWRRLLLRHHQRRGQAADHRLHIPCGGRHHKPVLRDADGGPGSGQAGGGLPAAGAPLARLLRVCRTIRPRRGHRSETAPISPCREPTSWWSHPSYLPTPCSP